MMWGAMMFGEEVSYVDSARGPVDVDFFVQSNQGASIIACGWLWNSFVGW